MTKATYLFVSFDGTKWWCNGSNGGSERLRLEGNWLVMGNL